MCGVLGLQWSRLCSAVQCGRAVIGVQWMVFGLAELLGRTALECVVAMLHKQPLGSLHNSFVLRSISLPARVVEDTWGR